MPQAASKKTTKLTLHKTVIRTAITYGCFCCEFAAEARLLKLQQLQNKILCTMDNYHRSASVRDMHAALHSPYVYDYITNYEGNRHKSFKIKKMKMFPILG
jgi:hypothetical protein